MRVKVRWGADAEKVSDGVCCGLRGASAASHLRGDSTHSSIEPTACGHTCKAARWHPARLRTPLVRQRLWSRLAREQMPTVLALRRFPFVAPLVWSGCHSKHATRQNGAWTTLDSAPRALPRSRHGERCDDNVDVFERRVRVQQRSLSFSLARGFVDRAELGHDRSQGAFRFRIATGDRFGLARVYASASCAST